MPAIVCVVIFFCRYGVNIDAFLMVAAYVMLCLFDILVVRLCYISEHKYMNDIKILILQFEAKFPKNKFEFADILLHVTPFKYLEKIKKFGLVPKSKSAEFKYDDRIYLFNQCSKNIAIYIKYIKDWFYEKIFSVDFNGVASRFCAAVFGGKYAKNAETCKRRRYTI